MMTKLVVSDFDGTLLPYGQRSVSKTTIEYIKELVSHGVSFAIASGRTYSELVALLRDVADYIYFICDDGAVTVKNDKVIFKKHFSLSSLGVFFDGDIYKRATLYSLTKAYLIGDNPRPELFGKTPVKISRAFEIKDEIFKISAETRCFDLVDTKDFRVHYSDGYFAEFVSPYANKGVALADLQLKLGISKFETVAIGDADNDIPMMSHSKYSWSIGDKSNKLKEVCAMSSNSAETVLGDILNNIRLLQNHTKQH